MSLVFFEELMAEQVSLIPAIQINANVSRKPSFGWGNSDDLRKFLAQVKEKHNPLVWSVPKQATDSGIPGIYSRPVELNLCCIESERSLLNKVRLEPNRSFKKVLNPLWDAIERRFQSSDITMTTDIPSFQLFPDYVLPSEEYETKYLWDVIKVNFNVNYSSSYEPCNS